MSLFDLFGSKKKRQAEQSAQALAELFRAMGDMYASGVDADELPKGHGPFGLCKTNPVPTRGVPGSDKYLARLRVGGRGVQAVRRGSTSAPEVTEGMIDMYDISVDGSYRTTLYVCPYHKRDSAKAPQGFSLA